MSMHPRTLAALAMFAPLLAGQDRIRARDLGIPFNGTPGATNSIVDVAGVTVGHTTLIEGADVRTGVTAIWPRGKDTNDPAFAGWWSLNGNGEMTGTTWIEESGYLDGPVLLTNTHSVGVVRDAFIQWQVRNKRNPGTNVIRPGAFWSMPVVAETFDGFLNDTNGFHIKPEHVQTALESASAAPPAEGSVGGGTGMICFGYKGGIGTASRRVGSYTVGALVQCNCGRREELRIAGLPLAAPALNLAYHADQPGVRQERGSIIIAVATDAPLLPHQMKRLARRAGLGLARLGATSSNYSGDIFVAFSTANPKAAAADRETSLTMLANHALDPLFAGVVESVEEAIANALVAATGMTGYQGHKVEALPHAAIQETLRKHARAAKP
jgi:L-aminopeptidase/D-esterase-like protein